ncbi:MAG: hypothetical protein K0S38_143 [Candidatus Paceibacter sp.]|jgi:cell shape-determining protein MreC|nr:hypothetical protein [Candidatus Paceibacter sp.]
MAMTLDKLTGMVKNQFDELREEMATKKDLDEVKQELKEEITEVKDKLDVIEGKLINTQENRISRLEDDMRVVKTKLDK